MPWTAVISTEAQRSGEIPFFFFFDLCSGNRQLRTRTYVPAVLPVKQPDVSVMAF